MKIKKSILIKAKYVTIATLFLISLQTFAGSSKYASATDYYVSLGPLQYKGSSDSQSFGELIGSTFGFESGSETFFLAKSSSHFIGKSYIETDSSLSSSGLTYTTGGVAYPVFNTGIKGIGFIYAIKDTNATNWTAPAAGEKLQSYPATGTETDARSRIGYKVKFQFIKTNAHLVSGTYTVPLTYVAEAYAVADGATATAKLYLNPVTITVSAASCVVSSGDNITVDMGSVSQSELSAVGSLSSKKTFTVQLACDEGVTVSGSITDQTDTSNTSDIVSLTSDSTASGVGVQFFYNGSSSPVGLGLDSSAKDNTNQFTIHTDSTTANEVVSVPLAVGYIRTGDITAGTANAVASLTFSYQ